jgi:hypothetical protein
MQSRKYIRHPVDIPIEASVAESMSVDRIPHAHSLSRGGLAFRCRQLATPGSYVHVRIAYIPPGFESDAQVVWCREVGDSVELGVQFLNSEDAFQARMVEQICFIEAYRQEISRTEGRLLGPEDAANEWIAKFAANFPEIA